MRLTFKRFDGRGQRHVPIIDEDTGKRVGYIEAGGVGIDRFGGIDISLFGGKYAISVNRYDQCWGFVKGVESVLRKLESLTELAEHAAADSDAA